VRRKNGVRFIFTPRKDVAAHCQHVGGDSKLGLTGWAEFAVGAGAVRRT